MERSLQSASARRTKLSVVTRFAFLLAGLAFVPAAAGACDCVRLSPGYPRFQQDLDRIAAYYPVAAEGMLERDGSYRWRFVPTRELRGPGRNSYSIDLISDCSLAPDEMNALIGRPIFALLAEHDGRYELSRCVNLQSPEVEKAIRERIGACGR